MTYRWLRSYLIFVSLYAIIYHYLSHTLSRICLFITFAFWYQTTSCIIGCRRFMLFLCFPSCRFYTFRFGHVSTPALHSISQLRMQEVVPFFDIGTSEKWYGADVFCTCWLEKCASRHSGTIFFDIPTSKSSLWVQDRSRHTCLLCLCKSASAKGRVDMLTASITTLRSKLVLMDQHKPTHIINNIIQSKQYDWCILGYIACVQ